MDPDYIGAYRNRERVEFALEQYESVIATCSEIIRLNSDDATAYSNRGLAKRLRNQPKEAITDFDKAIRLNPDYTGAYNNRAVPQMQLLESYERCRPC